MLTEEEKEYKDAAKKIKKIQSEQKSVDQNDFAAMMSKASELEDVQDLHKKAKHHAKRSNKP